MRRMERKGGEWVSLVSSVLLLPPSTPAHTTSSEKRVQNLQG